jgi:(+)-abscisic acid 8'-hydroxylase
MAMAFLLAVACIYIVSLLTLMVLLVEASRRRKTTGAGKTGSGTTEQDQKLPPGSLGLPLIGETLQLYTQNPKDFFASRLKRYFYKCPIASCRPLLQYYSVISCKCLPVN